MKIPLFLNKLMLSNGLRVISRLQLCPQLLFNLIMKMM